MVGEVYCGDEGWSEKSARCTVEMGVGGNVDCSAERHMNDTIVTSGGEI